MEPIPLTADQQKRKDNLVRLVREYNAAAQQAPGTVRKDLLDTMAPEAHRLHQELKAAGREPRHRLYMYRNRGVPPTDPFFYHHVHPVEDLLAFIQNPDVPDPFADTTLGKEFRFRYYVRRRGGENTCQLKRTEQGWWVSQGKTAGQGDKTAAPLLYDLLERDGVYYPAQLPPYFAHLWDEAARGLTAQEVQTQLDNLTDWVNVCESNKPNTISLLPY